MDRVSTNSAFDFLNTVVSNPTICFDVTIGNNGGFKAGPGRDQVTGFGVVDMGKLLAVLTGGTVVTPPPVSPPPVVTPPATGAVALLTSIETQIATFLAAQPHGHEF